MSSGAERLKELSELTERKITVEKYSVLKTNFMQYMWLKKVLMIFMSYGLK